MGPNDTKKDNAKKASADADDDLDREDSPHRKKKEQTTNTFVDAAEPDACPSIRK